MSLYDEPREKCSACAAKSAVRGREEGEGGVEEEGGAVGSKESFEE